MPTLSNPVVIVEDDPDLREAIHALLTEAGYTVAIASNCKQALATMLEWSGEFDTQVVLKKPFRVDTLLEAVESHCS